MARGKLSPFVLISTLLVLAPASNCLESLLDYANVPNLAENFDPDKLPEMRVLAEINLEGADKPESVLRRLQNHEEQNREAPNQQAVRNLLELANGDKVSFEDISYKYVELFRLIHLSKKINNKEVLLHYMMYYGEDKFREFTLKLRRTVEEMVEQDEGNLSDVEIFFKNAVSLEAADSSQRLYDELKSRSNVFEAKWDIEKLAKLARKKSKEGKKFMNLSDLFSSTCRHLRLYYSWYLDQINISGVLNANGDYLAGQIKLMNLNEFNRICLVVLRNRVKFSTSLSKQMSFMDKLFARGLGLCSGDQCHQ